MVDSVEVPSEVISNNILMDVEQDQVSASSPSSDDEDNAEGDGDSGGETGESEVDSSDEGDRQNDDDWSEESDSSAASSEPNEPEHEEDPIIFPPVLPAASIQFMAQSVGAPLSGYVAAALGHLAMNKLRHVLLISNQFRKHDQSKGLKVEHFTNADKLLGFSTPAIGHKNFYEAPEYKNIGKGMVVLQDSNKVDLIATNLHIQEHPEPFNLITGVSLTNHYLNSRFDMGESSNKTQSANQSKAGLYPTNPTSFSSSADSDSKEDPTQHITEILTTSSILSECKVTEKLESLLENIFVINEVEIPLDDKEKTENTQNNLIVGIEWVDYMKIFMFSFFCLESEKSGSFPIKNNSYSASGISSSDFKFIIEDITSNGVTPVLNILLSFFQDYMLARFKTYDSEGLSRILNVIAATLTCQVKVDEEYLHKIQSTLVRMISLTPTIHLHQSIAQAFILLMKKAPEDFSIDVKLWISKYVTENIASCLNSCLCHDQAKLILFNLAVSIAIALEEFGTFLSFDLGWHTLIMEFVQGIQRFRLENTWKLDSNSQNEKNSFVESLKEIQNTVMVFFYLFLKNYTKHTPPQIFNQIHSFMFEMFGEKSVSYLMKESFESFKQKPKEKHYKKFITTNRLRSVGWKSKRVPIGKIGKKK